MPQVQDRMLVIRRRKLRDADAMLTLVGQQLGKRTAKAPSLSKTSSKLAGTLQPYNVVDVVLYGRSEDQDIWTVTQAALVHYHQTLQNDITRLGYAACAVELVDALTEDSDPIPDIFQLLCASLSYWETHSPKCLELVAFHVRMLSETGLAPSFGSCIRCGAKDDTNWMFSAAAGGIVCSNCQTGLGRKVIPTVQKAFQHLLNGGKASQLSLSDPDVKDMMAIVHDHLEFHGAWQPKAWRFLEELMG